MVKYSAMTSLKAVCAAALNCDDEMPARLTVARTTLAAAEEAEVGVGAEVFVGVGVGVAVMAVADGIVWAVRSLAAVA